MKNLPLTTGAIRSALEQVCAIPLGDGVVFEIGTVSSMWEDDIAVYAENIEYAGIMEIRKTLVVKDSRRPRLEKNGAKM